MHNLCFGLYYDLLNILFEVFLNYNVINIRYIGLFYNIMYVNYPSYMYSHVSKIVFRMCIDLYCIVV